jgi:hypothetical protein
MQLIINNLIVLGIFAFVSIVALLYGFFSYVLLETTIIGKAFNDMLLYSQFFIWGLVHFLLARTFLKFAGNITADIVAFSLVIIFTIVFVVTVNEIKFYPEEMLKSPKLFLKSIWGFMNIPNLVLGRVVEDRMGSIGLGKLAYSISVLVYLLAQYFGMASRGIR